MRRGLQSLGSALLFVAAVQAPSQASGVSSTHHGDRVSVFSGDIHVPAGERVSGSVVCIGGDVVVEGEVEGDVVVILGSVELTGSVDSNLVGVLSDTTVRGGRVGEELVAVLGDLQLVGGTVEENVVKVLGSFEHDGASRLGGQVVNVSPGALPPIVWRILLWVRVLHKLAIFVLLVLLATLAGERVRAIGERARLRYVPAFFVGVLGYLGFFGLVGLAGLSLVAAPLIPLAYLLFLVLNWLGVAGLFDAVGRRVGRSLGREPSVLGSVLAVFAAYAVVFVAPTLLGWFGLVAWIACWLAFSLLFAVPGLGLVILTLAGGRRASPAAGSPGPESTGAVHPQRSAPATG